MAQNSQGMSEDTKAIIVVLLLIFIYPIGMILAWKWTNWPKWVKMLILWPVWLILFLLASSVLFAILRMFSLFFTGK